jgi:N12 class adenine-specific DNA methylase
VSINRSGAFVIAATGHHIKHPFLLPSEIFSSLFPHQKDGLEWLWRLHCEKSGGGILADDMGLGKTRQASAFLAGLFYSDLTQRVLIVAPGTILHQWIAELTKVGFNEDLIHRYAFVLFLSCLLVEGDKLSLIFLFYSVVASGVPRQGMIL